MKNKIINTYVNQFKTLYNSENWLDECYVKKIKQISELQAFDKPFTYLHSIAEVLSHVIEWRKEVVERLKTGRAPILDVSSAQNWKDNEVLQVKGWEHLCGELEANQLDLLAVLTDKDDDFLQSIWMDGYNYEFLVEGLVHHDLYHLGQIGLIYKIINQH